MEVEQLVAQVRSLLSEFNDSAIEDARDIVPALNRGQKEAASIIARKYPSLLMDQVFVTTVPNQTAYFIPTEAYEDRLLQMDLLIPGGNPQNGNYIQIKGIDYSNASAYENRATSQYPRYYYIIGRQFRLIPTPANEVQIRLSIVKDPEPLVLPYGRITSIGTNSLLVDEVRNSPSTTTSNLKGFVNVVDGRTGRIKGTVQLSSIDAEADRFLTSATPTRTEVLGRTVGTLADVTDVALDDFVCPIEGTCVTAVKDPVPNFLINWAKEDCAGSLGSTSEQMRDRFADQLETMGVMREPTLRVKRTKGLNQYRGRYIDR